MSRALQVDRVTKRFGAITAVSDLSLTVGKGEIVALLGPNGAGKSTLIRMIIGLIKPDAGSITRALDGGGRLGYLPEERGLYQDMPILRTLTYFGKLHGMTARDATDQATHWLDRLSLGDRGREKVKSLSKGNQQKVQFAAAILHRPALAILDEPFSGLDPVNQEVFLDLVRELRANGATVIFSAHQMTLVERLADRVFLMSRGREVLNGTIPELRKRWQAGERLVIGVAERGSTDFLASLDAVDAVDQQAGNEIHLRLKPDASISSLLQAVGQRMDVRYVRSEATSLHEIYVRTVEADAGPAARSEP